MKLTRYQRRFVAALVYMHGSKPSLYKLLAFRPLDWIPFVAIAIVAGLYYAYFDRAWGLFMVGLVIGAIARIVGQARFTLLAWPVTAQIIDWQKVEELQKKGNGA
jgi:hypothetical protein